MDGGNSGIGPAGITELSAGSVISVTSMPLESETYTLPRHYTSASRTRRGLDNKEVMGEGHRFKILKEIEVALEHIRKAQEEDDPMIRATEAFYLEDCLKVLWDMRGPRENEFKDLVNLLYLNLKYLTLENITNQQLEAYALILDQILRRTVRDEDFEKALDILEDNGIAPFAILASED